MDGLRMFAIQSKGVILWFTGGEWPEVLSFVVSTVIVPSPN